MGRISILLVASLLVLHSSASTYAQKAWEKKPYQQWSLSETITILSDSPWAQIRFEEIHQRQYMTVIRLRSALPLRQALVRQRQHGLNYDKFTVADKTSFDSDVKGFLECPACVKSYIVTLNSHALSPLREMSLEQVRPFVYLANDKGERRSLTHFVPPKPNLHEAIFLFDRVDDQGNPLITIASKKLYFKIEDELLKNKTVPIARFTFEVSKLVQNGKVIF